MPKHGMLIAGMLMLCVGAAGGDQLLRWTAKNAAQPVPTRLGANHSDAALSILPVSLLGPAMASGAQLRLDRSGPLARADLP